MAEETGNQDAYRDIRFTEIEVERAKEVKRAECELKADNY